MREARLLGACCEARDALLLNPCLAPFPRREQGICCSSLLRPRGRRRTGPHADCKRARHPHKASSLRSYTPPLLPCTIPHGVAPPHFRYDHWHVSPLPRRSSLRACRELTNTLQRWCQSHQGRCTARESQQSPRHESQRTWACATGETGPTTAAHTEGSKSGRRQVAWEVTW
jgi:hypothetical protein